jgi:hypothetical protein
MHEERCGGQPIVAFLEAAWILVAAGQFRHEIFERLEHRAILRMPADPGISGREWRFEKSEWQRAISE